MKKSVAMILIILIVFSITVFAYGTELNNEQKDDLYNLGIMVGDENGDLHLTENITRAETIKMICAAGNIELENTEDITPFPDVPEGHWAYKYIYAAKHKGIVTGDENGFFNPESDVTNEEIIKMIICLLGYEPMAETRGGYPAGFISQAVRLGITENMIFDINFPAVRNDVAVMICRALDIPIMEMKKEGEYVILDGNNFEIKKTLRDVFSNK